MMARVLRMPTEADLRPGTVRDLVEYLFDLYRRADRPTLRKISQAVADGDYRGAASAETIRRMLLGKSVPTRWQDAESVFLALCELAGCKPDEPYGEDDDSRSSAMKSLWNAALDEPERYWVRSTWRQSDPWSDEPPF